MLPYWICSLSPGSTLSIFQLLFRQQPILILRKQFHYKSCCSRFAWAWLGLEWLTRPQDFPKAFLASIFNFKAANQKMSPHHTAKAPPRSKFHFVFQTQITWKAPLKTLQFLIHPILRCQLIWMGLPRSNPGSIGISENGAVF